MARAMSEASYRSLLLDPSLASGTAGYALSRYAYVHAPVLTTLGLATWYLLLAACLLRVLTIHYSLPTAHYSLFTPRYWHRR